MPRFVVILSRETSITLNAIDEQDAQDKAEARLNKKNCAWVAADCYPVAKGK
jgi:hypothetical protein